MKNISVKKIVLCGMFAAIVSVLCPWSIPIFTIPVTLGTFAIALTGYCLGTYLGTISVIIYLLLGAIGIPVFSGFNGGAGVLLGMTGGYLIAYPIMAFACGLAINKINVKKSIVIGHIIRILIGTAGLLLLHLFGTVWFAHLTDMTFKSALLIASVPYLLKDTISVIIAYFIALKIRKINLLREILN
ncbi:MAG: biotin transporter BioY [Eubacterium sp.]